MPRLKFAMVCASNQNRSMEAHSLLQNHGFDVRSFGVGSQVKLPGPNQREPNTYSFGTPYETIYKDLMSKNPELYTRNGLLQMVQRNMQVKLAPERWQDNRDSFQVVLSFEERVMEQIIDDLHHREQLYHKPVLIINMNVKDSHEEAANAAQQALRLCQMLESNEDWEDEIDQIIEAFHTETGRRATYAIEWF